MTQCSGTDGVCLSCGHSLPDAGVLRACGGTAMRKGLTLTSHGSHPTFAARALSFAVAAARHAAHGMPTCTDAEVAARHAVCITCSHYSGGACTQCGCPIIRERAFVSKLSWADQACPVGKWGAISR